MSILSNVETAVLGILFEGEHHGYALEKQVKKRGMRVWTAIGFSSIYYVLKQLEKHELIKSRLDYLTGKPARRVYTITDKGRKALQDKVTYVLSNFEKMILQFDLGIAFHKILSPDQIILCLGRYLRSLDERATELTQLITQRRVEGAPYRMVLILERALAHVKTERALTEDLVMKLQRGYIHPKEW
ncbi:MAG: PadR family transcriptional regulator [Candidatus Ranarchaeia archaeon]